MLKKTELMVGDGFMHYAWLCSYSIGITGFLNLKKARPLECILRTFQIDVLCSLRNHFDFFCRHVELEYQRAENI